MSAGMRFSPLVHGRQAGCRLSQAKRCTRRRCTDVVGRWTGSPVSNSTVSGTRNPVPVITASPPAASNTSGNSAAWPASARSSANSWRPYQSVLTWCGARLSLAHTPTRSALASYWHVRLSKAERSLTVAERRCRMPPAEIGELDVNILPAV